MTASKTRFPWGDGPAPALLCDECGKRIGARRTHYITTTNHLLCPTCACSDGSTHRLHTKYHPDCPVSWHDMFDHNSVHATRAGAWFSLTNPNNRRAP